MMGWIKEIKNQKFKRKGYCQNGESYILQHILNNIGTKNKFLVDLGAWDGYHLSNTRLFLDNGWNGLLVDAKEFPGVYKSFMTVENIIDTFKKHNVPKEFDLLSVDIDGNDYWITKKVLEHYRPRLIIGEFNSEHPLEESKTVIYDPEFSFDNFSDYYGYTFAAGVKLAEEFGYTVIYQNTNQNMYYLRNDLVSEEPDFEVYQFRHWNGVTLKEWVTI